LDILQLIVLGIVQGLTEFLPVSSSAHLVLTSILLGWDDQGLVIDIAAHAGSLCAVMTYFRKEIGSMLLAITQPRAAESAVQLKMIAAIVLATLPIVIAGLLFSSVVEEYLRSAHVIVFTTIFFALLLLYADRTAKNMSDEYQLKWHGLLFIGCAQALALIPGTSRSGITLTAGLMLGLTKVAAARFSFLISIPTILAAIAYKALQVVSDQAPVDAIAASSVFIISGIVAYACIDVFLRLVSKVGIMPFVIYRLLLGVFLIGFLYL
jgi:undecaprenyl-diphosphatase